MQNCEDFKTKAAHSHSSQERILTVDDFVARACALYKVQLRIYHVRFTFSPFEKKLTRNLMHYETSY